MFVLFRSLQMQLNALLRVSDSVIVCSRFKDRRQEQREQAGAGDGHQRSMCLIDQEETRRQYVYLANRGQPCYEKKIRKKGYLLFKFTLGLKGSHTKRFQRGIIHNVYNILLDINSLK